VLRFTIRSAEEAKALAEAADILFLDVWEFNEDWADIRVAKDVVSRSHTHAPISRIT
jgi:extracellular matrix protein 14